jgi:hypothetical protein
VTAYDDNMEPIARALCARELRSAPRVSEAELPGLVDRFWPAVAAEMAAGLRGEDGNKVPHTVAAGIEAWENWLDDRAGRAFRR